ncbi:MAG: dihydrofolate reductase [Planctomycetota bacterium]|nr:dihydrofolate reductase [Planctomycetota bacterium]
MIVTIIAAMSENRIIGRAGALPWRLPADLKRFKSLTTGHTVIMGRRTYESIGRPLPDRRSIVVTRDAGYRAEGVVVVLSLEDALQQVADDEEVFIIGGGEIYRHALPVADRLELTILHAEVEGDTRFPALDFKDWTLIGEERHEADDRHAYPFTFRRYERAGRP